MIRYALRCAEGHDFDSWFASADAFDGLAARGLLSCAVCGGTEVGKAPMAPVVAARPRRADAPVPDAPMPDGPPPEARRAAEAALAALRDKLEREASWVGPRFAEEVRAIHAGRAPDRPVWGEARAAEARALHDEGIAVVPVPVAPRRKMN